MQVLKLAYKTSKDVVGGIFWGILALSYFSYMVLKALSVLTEFIGNYSKYILFKKWEKEKEVEI